jgi:hypothetical protein
MVSLLNLVTVLLTDMKHIPSVHSPYFSFTLDSLCVDHPYFFCIHIDAGVELDVEDSHMWLTKALKRVFVVNTLSQIRLDMLRSSEVAMPQETMSPRAPPESSWVTSSLQMMDLEEEQLAALLPMVSRAAVVRQMRRGTRLVLSCLSVKSTITMSYIIFIAALMSTPECIVLSFCIMYS